MTTTKKTTKTDNANVEDVTATEVSKAAEKVVKMSKAVEVETTKAIEKAVETATTTSAAFKTSYEEVVSANKQSIDAFFQSSEIILKGMQDMHSMCMAFMSTSMDKQTQAIQTAMNSKSIEAVVDVNTKLAEEAYNDFMANSQKVRDLGTKIAEKAVDPISTEISACTDRIAKAMAA